MASQKFDAIFGLPAGGPQSDREESKQSVDIEEVLAGNLAPTDTAVRKQSNVSSNQGANMRKHSNVSAGSANREL